MNGEIESFEKRLKRLPLRQVPGEWRKEILSVADDAQVIPRAAAASSHSLFSNLNHRLASLLWPHPVAWGGLAAIWIFISAVNFSIRDKTPVVAEKDVTPSPEMVAELRAQKRLYLELIDANASDSSDASRQKTFNPGPRSEVEEIPTA